MRLLQEDPTMREMLEGVQIPLENVEYTIEQYLLANGARLDTETRFLLAGVRDCVGRVAGSTRRLARRRSTRAAVTDARQGTLQLPV